MLRFKGKPREFAKFMQGVFELYGEKTTIKEVTQMLEALYNACM